MNSVGGGGREVIGWRDEGEDEDEGEEEEMEALKEHEVSKAQRKREENGTPLETRDIANLMGN